MAQCEGGVSYDDQLGNNQVIATGIDAEELNGDEKTLIPPLLESGIDQETINTGDDLKSDKPPQPEPSVPTVTAAAAPYVTYSRRWYVLILYAILGIADNMVYSTISPIAPIAEKALGLTSADISLLANWYNIMFIVGVFPYMWLIQRKGLRMPVSSGIVFVATGAFVRCLNTGGANPTFDRIVLHLGQALNGVSASVLWFACTKLSAVWFPPSERNVSTSIALMSGGFGVAISFLIGPYTVAGLAAKFADGGEPTLENYATAIHFLLYIEAVVCGILCAVTLFYFPSEPPTPPCYTAASERFEFLKGMRQFAGNPDCWLFLILYAGSGAALNGWTQFLAITVQDIMDNVQSGWLGFAVIVCTVISGPIVSLTTKFWIHRCPKLVCGGVLFIGASLTVLLLVAEAFVRSLLTPLLCWCTLVAGGFLITGCQPAWWEMAAEAAYPVPEQIVGGVFALGYTSLSAIYFVFYSFPQLGTQWPHYVLALGECACVPLIFMYSGKARRLADDRQAEQRRQMEINP